MTRQSERFLQSMSSRRVGHETAVEQAVDIKGGRE